MRLLFLILLLANLAALGYIHYAENRPGAEQQFALLQISPEKLTLLPAHADGKLAAPPRSDLVCLEWGVFAAEDVARAAAALAPLELGDRVMQRDSGEGGYWVYLAPHKVKAEADKKAGELKALGITDFYVLPENSPWRFAISLGVFRTEEAANNYLAQLRQKGVRSALAGARGAKSSVLVIRDPGDAMALRIARLAADFQGTEIKPTTCADAPLAQGQ